VKENNLLKVIEDGINKAIKEMLDKEYDLKIEEITNKMKREKDNIIGKMIVQLGSQFSVITNRDVIEIKIIK